MDELQTVAASDESAEPASAYDAILLVSFGGPDGPGDVMPFLENVLRGRNVPRERMLEVAEHYHHFGGKSPINEQNLALLAALRAELSRRGPHLPVYWGNRNWHPLLTDTLREMADAGVKRAIAFVTSAFSSYSGCRQYRENIAAASAPLGDRAPQIDKIRVFFNHPGFVGPMAANVGAALAHFPAEVRPTVPVLFTAHSIPMSMADGCRYDTTYQDLVVVSETPVAAFTANFIGYSLLGERLDHWDPNVFLVALASGVVTLVVVSLLTPPEPEEATNEFFGRLDTPSSLPGREGDPFNGGDRLAVAREAAASGQQSIIVHLLAPGKAMHGAGLGAYREDLRGFAFGWLWVLVLLAAFWVVFRLTG